MLAWQVWIFPILVGLLSGCSLNLGFFGGELLNPLDPQRFDPQKNSQELAFRVYQLKDNEKIQKVLQIPWESFVTAELPEELHPFLAVPADVKADLRPQEDFYIQRLQGRRAKLKMVSGTRWLLIVPRGGQKGDRAHVALVPVHLFARKVELCFDRYDVFERRSRLWPCQRPAGE